MAKTKFLPWDPAEHLNSDKAIAAYFEAALEDGDPSLVAAALGDIARARGMTNLPAKPVSGEKVFTRRCLRMEIRNFRRL